MYTFMDFMLDGKRPNTKQQKSNEKRISGDGQANLSVKITI